MQELKKNSSEVFPARWYKAGDREHGCEIYVAVVGTLTREKQQPVPNMRVSTDGTVVSCSQNNLYEQGDELYFLRRWWYIEAVEIDMTNIAPQAAKFGDPLDNAEFMLHIRAQRQKGQRIS